MSATTKNMGREIKIQMIWEIQKWWSRIQVAL